MNKIGKKIYKEFHPILKWAFNIYLSKPRNYTYKGIKVRILPSVFHPGFFYSTKVFLRFFENIDVTNKSLLELGCGSGLISIAMAKKGAKVTASDINPVALESTKQNAKKNLVDIEVIKSDLFENLSIDSFQLIVINPPYYPKNPKSLKDSAWFCGDDFDYFKRLFDQLSKALLDNTVTYMILSEDCDLKLINSIGSKRNIYLHILHKEKIYGEWSFIYQLDSNNKNN